MLKLNPNITLKITEDGDFLLFDKLDKSYYKLGRNEGLFLDGYAQKRSFEGSPDWDKDTVTCAEEHFLQLHILYDDREGLPQRKRKIKLDIVKIKFGEFEVEKLLKRHNRLVYALTGRTMVVSCLIVIALAAVAVLLNLGTLAEKARELLRFDMANNTAIVIIIGYILTMAGIWIHEWAHVLLCCRFCGGVGKMGFMLYFLQPALYSDLTCLNAIRSKRKRVAALVAGIFSQTVLGGIAILAYLLIGAVSSVNADYLLLFAMLNGLLCITNLIPFIKLDGYWILSILLGTQNLYENSLKYLFQRVTRKEDGETSRTGEARPLLSYGISAALFFLALWGYVFFSLYGTVKSILGPAFATALILTAAVLLIIQVKNSLSAAGCQQQ